MPHLLKVKLHAPAMNRNTVSRERLLSKLAYAGECRLTQVTAPAGYGKTTAVLDWLKKCGLPCAWLSLDAKDNHPVTFWRYVCAALDAIAEGISKDTEYVFSSNEMMDADIHLSILIDRLSGVEADSLLILDDLHLITEPSIWKGLSYLIDFLPEKIHLLFISRTEPEFGLTTQRVKWQGLRITKNDLRFEEEEIREFYGARGIAVENADLEKVEEYTGGWAAAMVAVALSMANAGGGQNALASLQYSKRDIGQYLRAEVISGWPPQMLAFAMKTSILDTLSGDLCNAVAGGAGGSLMLREVFEKSGFLTDMDGQQQSFRYHPLFGSFLHELLKESAPEEIPGLHKKAGLYFKERDQLPEAIEHFLGGGFYREAFELIEHQIDYLIDKNDFSRLLAWIKRLPDNYRDNSFKIAVIYTSHFAETGMYDLSRQWLGRMKALKDNYPYAIGPEWVSYSRTVSMMTEVNLMIREGNMAYVPLLLSAAETDGGKYYKMPEFYDFNRSDIYFCRCPISKVTDLYKQSPEQFDTMIAGYRGMISKNPGYAPLCAGEYLYESNRLEEALPCLLKAVEEAREVSCPGALVPAMAGIARIKRAGGDIWRALDILRECERQLKDAGMPHWNYLLKAFECRLFTDYGSMDKAREWLAKSKLNIFSDINRIREFELIVYARVLIKLNRGQDAEILLQRLLSFTGESKRLHSRVEVLNLLALLAFGNHQTRVALQYIGESLDIGMREGYIRSFLDESQNMAQILRAYIKSRGKQPEEHLMKERKMFAASLYKLMRGSVLNTAEANGRAAPGMAEPILDQLTEQEKRVLHLIASAATNREISERLGISLQTVKTHTGNIYGKLGLKNRAQCMKMVRELGLL